MTGLALSPQGAKVSGTCRSRLDLQGNFNLPECLMEGSPAVLFFLNCWQKGRNADLILT